MYSVVNTNNVTLKCTVISAYESTFIDTLWSSHQHTDGDSIINTNNSAYKYSYVATIICSNRYSFQSPHSDTLKYA